MAHSHHHQPASYNRAFALGVGLNVAFVAIEAGYGVMAGSLALIADAGHNLSDVLSLLHAWGASLLATRAATETHTYGFRKATIIAALASAILLLVVVGGIAWEAVGRFVTPAPVNGTAVIVVAAIGVVINTLTALLFASGRAHDLNVRGAFLHMAADAAVSLGVVVAGVIIAWTGWYRVDPLISLVIAVVVLVGTWGLLRDSVNSALDAAPAHIDMAAVRRYLEGLEEVVGGHDLHVWPLSTTEVALTVHLVVAEASADTGLLGRVQCELHDRFGIEHSTIQVEGADQADGCALDRRRCG